jgi:hypothetical protein
MRENVIIGVLFWTFLIKKKVQGCPRHKMQKKAIPDFASLITLDKSHCDGRNIEVLPFLKCLGMT